MFLELLLHQLLNIKTDIKQRCSQKSQQAAATDVWHETRKTAPINDTCVCRATRGAIQYSLPVIVFVSFSSLPTMLMRGFRGYTFMTNPQVPYRVILTGLCQGVFRVEAVRGLQHLLTCRFACKSIIKGWKLGWVRCRVYFGLI